MRYLTYQRLATAGATAVTMLALAAGAAAADGVRPDDRAMHGPGAIAVAQREIVVRPDDRADRRLAGVAVVAQPAATKASTGQTRESARSAHSALSCWRGASGSSRYDGGRGSRRTTWATPRRRGVRR